MQQMEKGLIRCPEMNCAEVHVMDCGSRSAENNITRSQCYSTCIRPHNHYSTTTNFPTHSSHLHSAAALFLAAFLRYSTRDHLIFLHSTIITSSEDAAVPPAHSGKVRLLQELRDLSCQFRHCSSPNCLVDLFTACCPRSPAV